MANGTARADSTVAVVRDSPRTDAPRLMPVALRAAVYAIFGGVWASGCVWWALRQFFAVADEFGTTRHPWEPTTAWLHGVFATATAFLFGWVMARHGSEGWQQRKRRVSGGLLTGVVAVLSISGFALFFLTDADWQSNAARVHEALGLLVTALAIEHWRASNGRTGA
jgi:hypothetical protein